MKELLDALRFPGEQELAELPAGKALALTGLHASLAAALAARASRQGRRVLLVMDNDLKASRAADDIRQLAGGAVAHLPGGEIDLTRAAGSLEMQ
jgi:transcription-repair coupling factor (superfamily II helicase)